MTNLISLKSGHVGNLTLDGLWEEARMYGLIDLFTHGDGSYSASIQFQSEDHTEIKVRSGFAHKTPQQALFQALQNARQTVSNVEQR